MDTMKICAQDKKIIRDLAARVAEIAALPVQAEKRAMWRKLNARKPVRPMVMIDQVCWNEINVNDELTLRCTDSFCRYYEDILRKTLYQWRHFPVDKVVESYIDVHKVIHNTGFGVSIQEEIAVGDPSNSVVGHKYENQFNTMEDLEKIKMPRIWHEAAETEQKMAVAHELFDGLLEVRASGADPSYKTIWDPVSMWMGVENALYMMVDNPELMHELLSRVTDGYLSQLDQLEAQGLLCGPQDEVHCTGAYTDDLPAPGYNPDSPRVKDLWMFSMAQMLGTVSPDMFDEFEVTYVSRIARRFGLVYYGCCEPLDMKMAQVRKIPNVRKVSMSPWVDQERGAAEMRDEFVYSRKPSPAFLATDQFHGDQVRADLLATRTICQRHGCPLEIILKDISTVRYDPARLTEWAGIAMQVVEG